MNKLTKNIGSLDRILRLVIGAAFIYIGFILLIGLIQIFFIILGIAMIINSITGFCGIYYLLGISTCKINKNPKK